MKINNLGPSGMNPYKNQLKQQQVKGTSHAKGDQIEISSKAKEMQERSKFAEARQEKVARYLATMQLSQWADRFPAELSGGMRQRVAIARAMANEPEVLLLDEPFGALDAQTRRAMHDFLLSVWARTGTTIVMVTHDVEEAIYLAQRVYVLSSRPGRVAAEITIPLGRARGPLVRRDPRFLDLRDQIDDLLLGHATDRHGEG
jgi:ABC-type nitrate/sulfonate/bicarbonate transport system ATPase subunit